MTVDNGPTTHFVLDGQSVVQEGHITGGQFVSDATYLHGPRGPEYRRDDSTGEVRWYVYDGLGSVLAEVDECGAINPDSQGNPTPVREYDVYGGIRNTQAVAPGTSDHKFVGSLGHTSEAETGLIYMRARYMDPALGRFISEDPAKDGVNWYVYCSNNPVSLVDRDGQEQESADIIATIVKELWKPLGGIATLLLKRLYSRGAFATAVLMEKWGLALMGAGQAGMAAGEADLRLYQLSDNSLYAVSGAVKSITGGQQFAAGVALVAASRVALGLAVLLE